MASKNSASLALFLALNILFFTLTAACGGGCGPKPKPKPKPSHAHSGNCPLDTLKLGVCVNALKGLVNVELGQAPVKPCCSLVKNLVDLEAAACLCTALKASVLGLKLKLPISLSLLLNVCSKKVPSGFQCA